MRFLGGNGPTEVDIFNDSAFRDFRISLNSEMKIQSQGLGSKKHREEPLMKDEEEGLWRRVSWVTIPLNNW